MAQKGINFKITAVNKTKQAFGQIGRGLKGITKAVFSFKTALTGAVGLAGLGLLVRNSLIATDRLGKMSNVLGIAVKDLQTMKLASEVGGIEFETFAKATRRLTDNFGDFLNGTGEATQTFKDLGISVADANALSGDQMGILELVADRLNLVENSTLKLKYAQELFGGRGAELINVLDGGSEALKKFAEESERFGSLNTQQVKAVEQFNDSVTRMKTVFANIVNQIVAYVSPAFQELSDNLREKLLTSIEDANGGISEFAKEGAEKLFNFAIITIEAFESTINAVIDFKNMIGASLTDMRNFFRVFKDDIKHIKTANVDFSAMSMRLELLRDGTLDYLFTNGKLGESFDKNKKKINDLNPKYKKLHATIVNLDNASDKFGSTIAGNFEKAVFEAKSFRETLANIGQDIIRIAYQVAVTRPLGEAIGGFFGDIFGGIGNVISGKKAMGGAVAQGQSYLVGERGAEIFTPNKSGYITPNNKLGGSDSIKVVQEINIMPSVSDVAKAEIFGMLPLIKQEALNGVIDARNRGGSVARSLGVKA
tara:strand:- start:1364 stop:2980 length:1617 start_codon:yes stop_codon:yes gene_type:complete